MGERKNGGYGSIHKMSNMELLGKLKAYAKWSSMSAKTASIADEILTESGLPKCNFKDDFKSKKYHDKLYDEATRRQLEIPQEWYDSTITTKDVIERIETAYYMHIRSNAKKTEFMAGNIGRIDTDYGIAREKAKHLDLEKTVKARKLIFKTVKK